MASVRKTARMREIELQDARIRGAALRDIRDIIDELFLDEGDLTGAAEVLQLDASTLSSWVNGPLRGRIDRLPVAQIRGRGEEERAGEVGDRVPPGPDRAGIAGY